MLKKMSAYAIRLGCIAQKKRRAKLLAVLQLTTVWVQVDVPGAENGSS